MSPAMTFTWGVSEHFTVDSLLHALIGGVVLGFSVVFKTGVLSGVMGISNYSKKLVKNVEVKRYFFIGGMVCAGLVMSRIYGGFEELPGLRTKKGFSLAIFARLAIGGLLVGIGASLQHGCTSGHGLTGLARLSGRSLAATITFMCSGAVAATLCKTIATYPALDEVEERIPSITRAAELAAAVLGMLGAIAAALNIVGKTHDGEGLKFTDAAPTALLARYALYFGEFIAGVGFGTGLVLSGMCRPSKVGGFLDLGSAAWDGSLMFVMGGALLITFPYFQAVEHCGLQSKAFLIDSSFDLPETKGKWPDRGLIMGAALFGAGWGIVGMCPGPIWVTVGGAPGLEIATAMVFMQLGLVATDMQNPFKHEPAVGSLIRGAPQE